MGNESARRHAGGGGAAGRGGRRGGSHGGEGRKKTARRAGGRGTSHDDARARTPRQKRHVDPAVAYAELRELLAAQYDDAALGAIEEGFAAAQPVTLRANALKVSAADVAAALDAADIAWRAVPWSADAFVIDGAREDAVRALALYEEGGIYLQSLSSMVPPLVLDPQPGEAILDMAAAPGGKTTQMAALSGGRAQITACERSAPRAERLRFNLDRQGAGRVSVLVQDARRLDSFFRFDKILLDAPCSGSGTVTRGEDGAWRTGFSRELLANCVRTQRGLLDKAVELLPVGGELVYSTCSILAQENEEQVARMLARGDMKLEPLDPASFTGMPLLPCGVEGALCIRPSELYEGFFVVRLQKTR